MSEQFPNDGHQQPFDSASQQYGQTQQNTAQYGQQAYPNSMPQGSKYWGMELDTYCMVLHLSQFLNFLFPCLGYVMPIVLWVCNKDNNLKIDAHGKIVLNWLISEFIYIVASVILCLIVIGVLGVIAVLVMGFVFPIIGAVKASNGILWKYPLSIPFFKVDTIPIAGQDGSFWNPNPEH